MDNQINEDKTKPAETLIKEDIVGIQQNRNILEEIKIINQEMNDPKYETFKKTKYWHEQSKTMENLNMEMLLKEMKDDLMIIEDKINNIQIFLEK